MHQPVEDGMAIFGLVDRSFGFADRIFGPTETKVMFKEHQIAIKLRVSSIQLFIDGKKVDPEKTALFPNKNVALLTASITEADKTHIIEVYGQSGFWQPKIKICIDQQKVGGDDF